jgi:O-antigen ligase
VSNFLGGNAFYTHYERYSAGDTNPDGFGFILALGIPVAWYLASSKNTTKWGKLFKVINYAYVPVAFLGIALSGTRTALIAAVPGMAFGLASLTRLSLWAKVSIFLFLASAVLILQPYVQPLKSFQRLGTTSAEITEGDLNNRRNNWREGLDSFEEHPLLGVGGNMYRSINSLGKVAHSSYLSVLVELGLIGLALFGTILAFAVIQAWGLPKWDSLFWLTSLLVWAIGASTLTWEYRKTTWLFLSLLVATAALIGPRVGSVARLLRSEPVSRATPYVNRSQLPRGEFGTVTRSFLKGKAR